MAQGRVFDRLELDNLLRFNSIRHLAVGEDGQVAFAMQWEGDPAEVVPLLGLHRRGAAPILTAAPLSEQRIMQGYTGSIAFDRVGFMLQATRSANLCRTDWWPDSTASPTERTQFSGPVLDCGSLAAVVGIKADPIQPTIAAARHSKPHRARPRILLIARMSR